MDGPDLLPPCPSCGSALLPVADLGPVLVARCRRRGTKAQPRCGRVLLEVGVWGDPPRRELGSGLRWKVKANRGA
jgi:hypothetical protein